MENYDLIVIGSGPAGYEGAIYASQFGMKVALIEKEQWLGGTCLNVGCIPAKSMLQSATMLQKASKFAEYGVKIEGGDKPQLDFPQVNKRRDEIVKTMTNGVGYLMKKNKVNVIRGVGSIVAKGQVEVTADGKKTIYACKNILIATGSRARHLPSIKIDGKYIVTSEEIWAWDQVPQTMAVLGGGVIGCEFASAYGRFGSKVTILEMADQICPTEDHETAAELTKSLKKQNCEILTSTKTKSIVLNKDNKVEVLIEGETTPRLFDKVLVSVGRAPNVENIGLEKVGIKLDERGFIPVDLKTYQTSAAGIYAVGDVLSTPQLAHTASAEALFAVDIIAGHKRQPINYLTNPAAIYTYPEIASIGHTENQLKKMGREYKSTKFPFSAIAKARIDDMADGFLKLLVDPKYGEILGVHIVNAKASEMISEFALGNNLEMTIEELSHTIHPHPTVSEIIKEAAHAAMGHPINM